MTDEIIKRLTSSWLATADANLARNERYYDAKQTLVDNGMFTAADQAEPAVKRLFQPINLVSVVINEPVASLASGKLTVISNSGNPRIELWAADYYRRRIRSRMDDWFRWSGLFGESYLYLWTDREGRSRGLKTMVLPPVNGGVPRVLADYGGEDPEELTAAVMYSMNPIGISGGVVEFRTIVTATDIRVDKRERKRGQPASLTNDDWELVREGPNAAGVLPVIPLWNPTPSDITDVIQSQDDYDKLLVNWRSAEEFVGFPAWATDAHLDDSSPVSVGPNKIMSGGNWSVLDTPGIEPFVQRRQVILEDAANAASSVKLARIAGAAVSGVALQYLQRSFTDKLEGKAALGSSAVELALWTAARILAVDKELYDIETANLKDPPTQAELAEADITAVLLANVPADAKADAEVGSILYNMLGASQETALARAGIDNPQEEIERARAEREADLTPFSAPAGLLEARDEQAEEPEGDQ